MNRPQTFSAQSRGLGKRERTRAHLIDTTIELIAEGGVEAATVLEIASRGGVAPGTFYNHFEDRTDIIRETALRITERIGARIGEAGQDEQDIVLRFAFGTRRFFDVVRSHPTWAMAVLGSIDYIPSLRPTIYKSVGATIHTGREAGIFDAEDDLTFGVVVSMLVTGLRAHLNGYAGEDLGSRIAEMQLRALGVEIKRARHAATTPLPEFDMRLIETVETRTPRRRSAGREVAPRLQTD